jgi:hypothetical protein
MLCLAFACCRFARVQTNTQKTHKQQQQQHTKHHTLSNAVISIKYMYMFCVSFVFLHAMMCARGRGVLCMHKQALSVVWIHQKTSCVMLKNLCMYSMCSSKRLSAYCCSSCDCYCYCCLLQSMHCATTTTTAITGTHYAAATSTHHTYSYSTTITIQQATAVPLLACVLILHCCC